MTSVDNIKDVGTHNPGSLYQDTRNLLKTNGSQGLELDACSGYEKGCLLCCKVRDLTCGSNSHPPVSTTSLVLHVQKVLGV
jgi:hypothetical protein